MPLTQKIADDLGGALARLHELGESKIITKEVEAERAALTSFVNKTAAENVAELLGSWFTVRQQYQPLLMSIATVARSVGGILALQQQHALKAHEAATATQS